MNIYGISGLGVDERAFSKLTLDTELQPIRWLKPLSYREPLPDYARRLAAQIDRTQPFILIGLSFGGIMAVELNKLPDINPEVNILISSVDNHGDIPLLYRIGGPFVKWIPRKFTVLPDWWIKLLFRSRENALLDAMLKDSDPVFNKWAIGRVCNWKNALPPENVIKLGGSRDLVLPPRSDDRTIILDGAGHFMIADRAREISSEINYILSMLQRQKEFGGPDQTKE